MSIAFHSPVFFDSIFSFQLDKLILKLSEAAPLKSHKYFRVTVPQALTGQTLVQLLQDLLQIEDASDALHLAT